MVADCYNDRVTVLDLHGQVLKSMTASALSAPFDVLQCAGEREGYIVANYNGNGLTMFVPPLPVPLLHSMSGGSSQKDTVVSYGEYGSRDGEFKYPAALAQVQGPTHRSTLVVLEPGNRRFQVWSES